MSDVDDRVIDWAREDASHDHVVVCRPCAVGLHELCESVECECGDCREVAW